MLDEAECVVVFAGQELSVLALKQQLRHLRTHIKNLRRNVPACQASPANLIKVLLMGSVVKPGSDSWIWRKSRKPSQTAFYTAVISDLQDPVAYSFTLNRNYA